MPLAGSGRVVRDHGEVALFLTNDLVDQALGRPDGHETADHQAGTVGIMASRSSGMVRMVAGPLGTRKLYPVAGTERQPKSCRGSSLPLVRAERAD